MPADTFTERMGFPARCRAGPGDTATLTLCRNHRSRLPACRLHYNALNSHRPFSMPPLDDALSWYLKECATH